MHVSSGEDQQEPKTASDRGPHVAPKKSEIERDRQLSERGGTKCGAREAIRVNETTTS